MAVGLPQDKTTVDQMAGSIALNLLTQSNNAKNLNSYFQRIGSAGLVSMGYSSADAASLMALFAALANLNEIGHGRATQAAANDFWFSGPAILGPAFFS